MANPEQFLQALPAKRIKPADGMSVTADVWEEAHDYHRHQLRAVARLGLGHGVLTGLNVIASDPADRSVYVTPGAALDGEGNLIVVSKPVAFNLANAIGDVRLYLSFGESAPRLERLTQDDNALRVRQEYAIEAGDKPPSSAHVELARILRSAKTAPATNPRDASHPVENEIDTRFRRVIGPGDAGVLAAGIVQVGRPSPKAVAGINALARSAARAGIRVAVDDAVAPGGSLGKYGLIFILASGAFTLKADDMKGLYAALQGGATLVAEAAAGDGPAEAGLRDLFQTLGVQLRELGPGHALMGEPHVFGLLPAGAAGAGALLASDNGVLFSLRDFATLWQGERADGPASREEIRAGHEFGQNVLAWAGGRVR